MTYLVATNMNVELLQGKGYQPVCALSQVSLFVLFMNRFIEQFI